MIEFWQKNKASLFGTDVKWLQKMRDDGFKYFLHNESNSFQTILDRISLPITDLSLSSNLKEEDLNKDLLGEYRLQQKSTLLVFVNGAFVSQLSDKIDPASKVICMELAQAVIKYRDIVEQCFASISIGAQPFTALNLALMNSGLFLHIPENTVVNEPFHFLFLATEQAQFFTNIHNLIVVAKNSKAVFLEEHLPIGTSKHFCNVCTELYSEESVNACYFQLQNGNKASGQISNLTIKPGKNAKVEVHYIINGSLFARDSIHVDLQAENIFFKLKGLYMTAGDEYAELRTRVNHNVPSCASTQLVKGVVKDASFSDFNGRVYVQKNAIKTDAHLTNRNLLLSDKAQIKTSPELEIYADDVNCSHGATVGQLDEQMLFYLRARGIDEVAAKKLLVAAFVSEVTNNFIKNFSIDDAKI